ncbi:unnamed protein product [Chrysoparadoxa australica]
MDRSPRTTIEGGGRRRGKWTAEEEAYCSQIIHDFREGLLDVPAGTTLRLYLSESLSCDPMRISKKYSHECAIGKRVFRPVDASTPENAQRLRDAQVHLKQLEEQWKDALIGKKETKPFHNRARSRGGVVVEVVQPLVPSEKQSLAGDEGGSYQAAALWLQRAGCALTSSKTTLSECDQLVEQGERLIMSAVPPGQGIRCLIEGMEEMDNERKDEIEEAWHHEADNQMQAASPTLGHHGASSEPEHEDGRPQKSRRLEGPDEESNVVGWRGAPEGRAVENRAESEEGGVEGPEVVHKEEPVMVQED